MAFVFHRGLTIPLWVIAFFAVALAAPPRLMPPAPLLLGVAVIALTMMAMIQWRRASRPLVEVFPVAGGNIAHAGLIVTTMSAAAPAPAPDNAIDLVRLDDGGWQTAREPALPIVLIPGARERGMSTTPGASAASVRMPEGPSTMDAATIAERRREGGGAPSQRRRPVIFQNP